MGMQSTIKEKFYRVGIDIGGSHIAAIIIDNEGNIIGKAEKNEDISRKSNDKKGNKYSEKEIRLIDIIEKLVKNIINETGIDSKRIESFCAGVPGTYKGTTMKDIPNANIKNFEYGKAIRERFINLGIKENILVLLENDANCAAIGEFAKGVLKGIENGINIVVSTGIGAGLIINGKLYKGANNAAGEIGHIVIDKNAETMCNCGRRGCSEVFSSLQRLRINMSKELDLIKDVIREKDSPKVLDGKELELLLGYIYNIEVPDRIKKHVEERDENEELSRSKGILELMKDGHLEKIKDMFEIFKSNLVQILANIVNIYAPEKISIGSAFSYFAEPYLPEIMQRVAEESLYKEYDKNGKIKQIHEITIAKLRNDAGLIGAAMLPEYLNERDFLQLN